MANETTGGMNRQRDAQKRNFTVNGATPVAVADTRVRADTIIENTIRTVGGTPGARTITSKTPGVGFTVVGTAGDTSTYVYNLV
jgi:hypothetical protein